jgi:hypothetical protein
VPPPTSVLGHVRFTPKSGQLVGQGRRVGLRSPIYAGLLCATSREFCLQLHSLRHGLVPRAALNYSQKRHKCDRRTSALLPKAEACGAQARVR